MRFGLVVFVTLYFVAPVIAGEYCFEEAALEYEVPAALLWAIAKVESDFDPSAYNSNGVSSFDVGVMQINSSWRKTLGEPLWQSLGDVCTNIKVGAWVLSDCLQRYGLTYRGIGCYNALSENKRVKYAKKVIAELRKIEEGVYGN
jgi:soluble lytic murein transglycosylase-like protein